MKHELCDSVGHEYKSRYSAEYCPIAERDAPDFPVIMILLGIVTLVISTVCRVQFEIFEPLILSGIYLFASILIYYRSRFKKTYRFDICTKCGTKIT